MLLPFIIFLMILSPVLIPRRHHCDHAARAPTDRPLPPATHGLASRRLAVPAAA